MLKPCPGAVRDSSVVANIRLSSAGSQVPVRIGKWHVIEGDRGRRLKTIGRAA